jgi:hypothetical protein
MIVSGMAPPRATETAPIDLVSKLLTAARSDIILSGTPMLVRLHKSAIEIGTEKHAFSSPIGILLAEAAADEVAFLILPDGTRTGGKVLLTAGQSRLILPLVSRGTGT